MNAWNWLKKQEPTRQVLLGVLVMLFAVISLIVRSSIQSSRTLTGISRELFGGLYERIGAHARVTISGAMVPKDEQIGALMIGQFWHGVITAVLVALIIYLVIQVIKVLPGFVRKAKSKKLAWRSPFELQDKPIIVPAPVPPEDPDLDPSSATSGSTTPAA
jgi:hypothetical protein